MQRLTMRQFCSEVRSVLVAANLRKALGAIACDGIGHPSSLTITQHERGTKAGFDYQSPAVIARVLQDAGYVVHVYADIEKDASIRSVEDAVFDKHGFVWTMADDGILYPACASVVVTLKENPTTPVPVVQDDDEDDVQDDAQDVQDDVQDDAQDVLV